PWWGGAYPSSRGDRVMASSVMAELGFFEEFRMRRWARGKYVPPEQRKHSWRPGGHEGMGKKGLEGGAPPRTPAYAYLVNWFLTSLGTRGPAGDATRRFCLGFCFSAPRSGAPQACAADGALAERTLINEPDRATRPPAGAPSGLPRRLLPPYLTVCAREGTCDGLFLRPGHLRPLPGGWPHPGLVRPRTPRAAGPPRHRQAEGRRPRRLARRLDGGRPHPRHALRAGQERRQRHPALRPADRRAEDAGRPAAGLLPDRAGRPGGGQPQRPPQRPPAARGPPRGAGAAGRP